MNHSPNPTGAGKDKARAVGSATPAQLARAIADLLEGGETSPGEAALATVIGAPCQGSSLWSRS